MILRLRVGLVLGRFVNLVSTSSGKPSQNGIFLRASVIAEIDSDLMIFPGLMTTVMVTPIPGPLKLGIKASVKTVRFPFGWGLDTCPACASLLKSGWVGISKASCSFGTEMAPPCSTAITTVDSPFRSDGNFVTELNPWDLKMGSLRDSTRPN